MLHELGSRRAQSRNGRCINRLSVGSKDRAVARAVPAGLKAVPVQMTSDMGATGRMKVQFSRLVPVSRDLFETLAQDGALTRFELLKRGDFTWRDVLCEVLQDRHVLAQEIPRRCERFAIRRIDRPPGVILAENEG